MNISEQAAIDAVPFDIFDQHARLRTDFSDAEIAKLPAPKKKIFFELIKAWTAESDAEADHKASKEKLYATVREKDEAAIELGKERRTSFFEARKEVIRARNEARGLPVAPKKVDEAKQARIKELESRFEELELAMYEGQLDLEEKDRKWKAAREAKTAATKLWTAAYPPLTHRQNLDQHLARLRKHAETGATVVHELKYPQEHIDSVLSAGARGANVNYGYGRPHAKIGTRVPLPKR